MNESTENRKIFELHTQNTSYIIGVMESRHLEHLYYGSRISLGEPGSALYQSCVKALQQKRNHLNGSSIQYSKEDPSLCMNDVRLEVSGRGTGDFRQPFADFVWADGSSSVDFVYESHEWLEEKKVLETLPSSYDEEGQAHTLVITLKEKYQSVRLKLFYSVFADCDCIVRSAVLCNDGKETVHIRRLMSLQLDLEGKEYDMISFHGDWAKEQQKFVQPVTGAAVINSSVTGFSSNQANPFTMLAVPGTGEEQGECYACNLIYSGNHYEAAQVSSYDKTRFLAGINPDLFDWTLEPGERFETPEAVITYSDSGFCQISRHMHAFVREHVVRGAWKKQVRPILLNSWEASYFRFTESSLLKLAKAGKEAGIELFVLDDGWFGQRNSDTCSLGDWKVNTKKLPGGLKRLAEKITDMGLMFGIWVEPEMVNEDSDLFLTHPDWAVRIPGRDHAEGRNQMLLDLTRQEVQDNVIEQMTEVFASGPISYVKWDMNRNFSDRYSHGLTAAGQGEFSHRYMMGLYRVLKTLTERFPHILFESCASGGNRFDLGMLCYMPQIWTSDNSDAISRAYIQNGCSYGYPQSVMGAHVSACPNHQTLRDTPLTTRFAVASFGVLGYECNLCEMTKEELEEIKEQIRIYKEWRLVLQYGQFYRLGGKLNATVRRQLNQNLAEWLVVSCDKQKAVGMTVQETVTSNVTHSIFRTKGLDEDTIYHFTNRTLKYDIHRFGGLINTLAPVHIKQDSLLHNTIAHFMKMDGETEDYTLPGRLLDNAGVELAQAFGGTGYNTNTRLYQDFDARLYFLNAVSAED